MSNPATPLLPSRVQFSDQALTWREAVALAAQPLIADGAIEPGYVEAIIATAEEMGPYFDFGRGVAMPHARGEGLVHSPALSFLRTRTPVLLLDDPAHPIEVFLLLATPDNTSHLSMLRTLAGVLTDPGQVEAMKAATTPDDVVAILGGNQNNHRQHNH
ncbi:MULTISPECIES: PTS sugar transporter subunit IIA [unclassified Luteococcus]|uniref:PTS sugar transporter subunit IIA n=1 Tax=unclassified Luteococcus TaxID=2639923 RepID=UPI00313C17A6